MKHYDVVVIGGGPAGMAAALSARKNGIQSVLILERSRELGGILNQCIHNGFGLRLFQEELTGPEYAQRFISQVEEAGIAYCLDTMVTEITPQKEVRAVNPEKGYFSVCANSVILAMGCRERPRGALNIPGCRPAGIYSAGTAQRLMNIDGCLPGKEVVILGSGDIGLIMARRLTLEGAHVKLVAELQPYSGGLQRNIVQCLEDFDIPLQLCHTVVEIKGKERVEGVVVAEADAMGKPVSGTEKLYECDTLLLSCGLIPENELSSELGIELNAGTSGARVNQKLETSIRGIFACGNVLHVHDLADNVSQEAYEAGKNAAEYVQKMKENRLEECDRRVELIPGYGIRYTVPGYIEGGRMNEKIKVRFRVSNIFRGVNLSVYCDNLCMMKKRRDIMRPGEMEEIDLPVNEWEGFPDLKQIRIELEGTEDVR